MWSIIKSKQLMIYVKKSMKKVDSNSVQEVTGAFFREVYSVEKYGDED